MGFLRSFYRRVLLLFTNHFFNCTECVYILVIYFLNGNFTKLLLSTNLVTTVKLRIIIQFLFSVTHPRCLNNKNNDHVSSYINLALCHVGILFSNYYCLCMLFSIPFKPMPHTLIQARPLTPYHMFIY